MIAIGTSRENQCAFSGFVQKFFGIGGDLLGSFGRTFRKAGCPQTTDGQRAERALDIDLLPGRFQHRIQIGQFAGAAHRWQLP